MLKMKLSLDIFNWDDVCTHISEFVRIDEHLRLKQMALDTISPELIHWTYLAGLQITEHKRILINMRCFLIYHAREIWGEDATMFSKGEYEKIKAHEDNLYTLYKDAPEFNAVSNGGQFWFLMQAIDDKEGTIELFKRLVDKFYRTEDGYYISGIEKKNLINNIQWLDVFSLFVLIGFICLSQMARITIPIVSARQLAFLETNKKNKMPSKVELKSSTLLIRFNQAGIFPIIIASNILPLFSYLIQTLFGNSGSLKILINLLYYVSVILFNYFYTNVFWDPEKISEQLRKSSVSVVNVTPGRQTVAYLENVVRSSSIVGGLFLCFILYSYDFLKVALNSSFLNQINISSVIILVGVIFEIQKTIRGMYKTII